MRINVHPKYRYKVLSLIATDTANGESYGPLLPGIDGDVAVKVLSALDSKWSAAEGRTDHTVLTLDTKEIQMMEKSLSKDEYKLYASTLAVMLGEVVDSRLSPARTGDRWYFHGISEGSGDAVPADGQGYIVTPRDDISEDFRQAIRVNGTLLRRVEDFVDVIRTHSRHG